MFHHANHQRPPRSKSCRYQQSSENSSQHQMCRFARHPVSGRMMSATARRLETCELRLRGAPPGAAPASGAGLRTASGPRCYDVLRHCENGDILRPLQSSSDSQHGGGLGVLQQALDLCTGHDGPLALQQRRIFRLPACLPSADWFRITCKSTSGRNDRAS